MRRWILTGAGLLALAMTAPAAQAATYDVVSCGAPGAGDSNVAWQPQFTDFTNPNNGQYFGPEPQYYDLENACGSSSPRLEARPKVGGEGRAGFLRGAQWRFDAPDETKITKLVIWRFGVKLRTNEGDPDPNTEGDQGDPWEISGVDAGTAGTLGGNLGETCDAAPGTIGCSFGKDEGISDASRATYDLNTQGIAYRVICASLSGCDRYFADTPVARVKVFGSRITITDNGEPGLEVGGSLLAAGFRGRTDSIQARTSDASGIRAVRFELDGARVRRDALNCDYRRAAPCPRSDTRSFSIEGIPLADGRHQVAVVAEDAAGNEKRADRSFSIDANGPQIAIGRLKGRTIAVDVSDAGSGVTEGLIEVRDGNPPAYRPLPTRLEGGRLIATLDRGDASRIGLRVTARDAAGNASTAEGLPTRITATSARVGKRTKAIRGGRLRPSARQRVTIRGVLKGVEGTPLAGRRITVSASLRRTGAGRQTLGTTTTGPGGRFSAKVPPGPSRLVRLEFDGEGGGLPSSRAVSLRVRASSTIRASTRTVRGRARVRFSGRLRTSGQPVPRGGKLVELQAREKGRWRTFATTRARGSRAAWQSTYRFGGRPDTYPIRLRIRRESSFPFELGYSRSIAVRVR